jgi:hypothetical protein
VNSGQFWRKGTLKKTKGTISLVFREQIAPGLSKEEFFEKFEQKIQRTIPEVPEQPDTKRVCQS